MPREKYVSVSMTAEAKRLLDEIKSIIGTDRYEELFRRVLLRLKGSEEEEECRRGVLKILEAFDIKLEKDGTIKGIEHQNIAAKIYLDVECSLLKEDLLVKKELSLLIKRNIRDLGVLIRTHFDRYMIVKIIHGYQINIDENEIIKNIKYIDVARASKQRIDEYINEFKKHLRSLQQQEEKLQHKLASAVKLLESLGYIVLEIQGPVKIIAQNTKYKKLSTQENGIFP